MVTELTSWMNGWWMWWKGTSFADDVGGWSSLRKKHAAACMARVMVVEKGGFTHAFRSAFARVCISIMYMSVTKAVSVYAHIYVH